jgi:hypothetical protein
VKNTEWRKTTKWKTIDLPDGKVDLHIVYDNGESDHILVQAPPGAGRNLYLQAVIHSIASEREARSRAEGATTKTLDHQKSASPPPLAELLVSFLAPKNSAQAQLGDLQEMFETNVSRLGEQHARRKYWIQVASSFGPLCWEWLKRIGLVTFVVDYVRSKLGL